MKNLKTFGSILITSLLFFTACNNDESKSGDEKKDTSTTIGEKITATVDTLKSELAGNKDENFVTDVIKSNAKEMAWLKAGITKGTDNELKSSARMMLADHKKMDTELKAYAKKKNFKMPDVDTANVADSNDKGKDWDKDWADKMVSEHKDLVDKFNDNMDDVKDPDLKKMIAKNLPTLKSHLAKAEKLQARLKK